MHYVLALEADNIRLETAGEDPVDDARALNVALRRNAVDALRVAVEHVQSGYEELVRILLLVARQMTRLGPNEVEQARENQRLLVAREELVQ